jgi:hypothetical protein
LGCLKLQSFPRVHFAPNQHKTGSVGFLEGSSVHGAQRGVLSSSALQGAQLRKLNSVAAFVFIVVETGFVLCCAFVFNE